MKATFQNLFDGLKTTFSDAVASITFNGKTTTGLLASPFTLSAMGFASPDSPSEGSSVMARSDQLDACKPGDPITVGAYGYIVTSYSIDQVGAIHTIGLSQPFDKEASFTGTRRDGAGIRELFTTVPCIITGGQANDSQSGSFLPSSERSFMLVVRSVDWSDTGKPQSGDSVAITDYPALKVVSSIPVLGGWNVELRTKGTD